MDSEPDQPGHDAERERRKGERDRPPREVVERHQRGDADPEDPGLVALQAPLLPEIERGECGREREAGERRENEADVRDEEQRRVAARVAGRPAARVGDGEEDGGERHDRKAEQAVTRLAAPDQVGADDEPDEEVERTSPARPGKAVGVRRLHSQQRRLREPAEPHAPRPDAAEPQVGDRRDRVPGERGPEERLSQPPPPPATPARARAPAAPEPARRARPAHAGAAGASAT